ncbi:hypothetical protein BDV27DRAFT_112963 [Aspergillus caelatus]|uniref:C2H2-type domain-containing protein n=1 Tax=Aspergillus caelatus TaxID=61420 RepID=A0A5N7A4T3_9EURO|nr:uncharacterized protein BDV27DRAFT_112963 [Aspergillus caelatus]KAE8364593.1 hypothetical protein BDV27DRAFT_112963 [Aspergillus caelatus]
MDPQGDLNITNFDGVYPDTQAPLSLLSALLQGDNTNQNFVTSDDHTASLSGYTQHAPLDICPLNEEVVLPEMQMNEFLDDGSSYSFYDTHDIGTWNVTEFQKPPYTAGYDGQLQQSPSVTSTQNLSFFEPDMASRDFDSLNASLPCSRSNSYSRLTGSSLSTPPSISSDCGMDPMQRWRESPPETEAASLSAIADALRTVSTNRAVRSSSGGRAESVASLQSGTSRSSSSIASTRSSRSVSRRSPVPKFRGRVRKTRNDAAIQKSDTRIFHCTFCCDSFRRKHDWTRHEKSLHLNVDQWACAPYGGSVLSATGRNQCAYCNLVDPTDDHLESHNHSACHSTQEPRFFRRKDHLVQHLRGFHNLKVLPTIEDWKVEPPLVTSRCGFCDEKLPSWQARADHLASHFRQGLTMSDWKGDHCFEPSIAAQIKNGFPPYLLASEAKSMVPFSATDPATLDHLSQIYQRNGEIYSEQQLDAVDSEGDPLFDLTPTSYLRWVTFRLGRFAQQSIANGIFPTDKMFQDESRRLVYGDKDAWEQTVADNNEWLTAFRRQCLPQI